MTSGVFEREFATGRSVSDCWTVLTDVERMITWVDIVHETIIRAPLSEYRAVIEDRIGPFRLRADLDVQVTELTPPTRIRFRASGQDQKVGARLAVEAGMSLRREGDHTQVRFDGHYLVEGRVATMGAPMIRRKAEGILDQFLARARQELQ